MNAHPIFLAILKATILTVTSDYCTTNWSDLLPAYFLKISTVVLQKFLILFTAHLLQWASFDSCYLLLFNAP